MIVDAVHDAAGIEESLNDFDAAVVTGKAQCRLAVQRGGGFEVELITCARDQGFDSFLVVPKSARHCGGGGGKDQSRRMID